MLALDDTIAAVATPLGAGAARGIIRISGTGALDCLRRTFAPCSAWPEHACTSPHVLGGELIGATPIPCDAYLWPSRQSYTREPVVELHTLGSPPLLELALRKLCAHGIRLAQPGEFTLRAFFAGRLDLTQAEAVLGVIDAQDRRALDAALGQLAGGLAAPVAKLRGDLLDLLADLEAGLDFVEEHIEFVTYGDVKRRLEVAGAQLRSLAETLFARSVSDSALRVALVGWPNAGKSSLYNALVGHERSIVSPQAGTTRDYLHATIDCDGVECILLDTAGVETAPVPQSIAAVAQSLSELQGNSAELRLLCIDATRALNEWEQAQLQHDRDALVVLTKCDCRKDVLLDRAAIETSAVTGQGLEALRTGIAARLQNRSGGHAVASTAARCRDSVQGAIECLTTALALAGQRAGDELVAAEVRLALNELGKVTGAVYTEDVLDRIFSRFCIGK